MRPRCRRRACETDREREAVTDESWAAETAENRGQEFADSARGAAISRQAFEHHEARDHDHDHVEYGDHPENAAPPDDRREKNTQQRGHRRREALDRHQCGESRGCSPAVRDVGNDRTSDDDGGPARDALE